MKTALRSLLTAIALVTASIPQSAWADQDEVDRLYQSGQDKFDSGEFEAAALIWAQTLDLIEESKITNSTRAMVLLNALGAYSEAFNQTGEIKNLYKANELIDSYTRSLKEVYGDEADSQLRNEIKDARDNLLESLRQHDKESQKEEEQAQAQPAPQPAPAPASVHTEQAPADSKSSKALIIGGAVTAGLGVVATSLAFVGMSRGNAIQADSNEKSEDREAAKAAMDSEKFDELNEEINDLHSQGKTMNAMAIASGIAASLLIAGGVTMLVIGLKQKKDSEAGKKYSISPAWGKDFAGLSLQGRF